MPHEPLAFIQRLKLTAPSSADKTADKERLFKGLQDLGITDAEVSLDLLRRLPEELRKTGFELPVVLGVTSIAGRWRVIDIGNERAYGIAIDIGSTNIECSLFDLANGEKIHASGIENPQVAFGPDVLTRVQLSMLGQSRELSASLLGGINRLVNTACEASRISSDDIAVAAIAGNTIESHFFLGLDVRNIPISPYIPAANDSVFTTAAETGLRINRNGLVYVFPNAGSYVGGDIISGILHSGIHRKGTPCLFIDVGTNVEITLGCNDWIMTGAGAAGPALEGGIAAIGRKAEPGTISKVRTGDPGAHFDLTVIGGREPEGICGSGLIDLVSGMFSAGIIDASGKFRESAPGIIESAGEKAYAVYRSNGRGLYLRQSEIKNFLLSKAAMFSFLYVFVKSVGLTFRDIEKVYVGGALGCGIDVESAVKIGMLPDIPREKFALLGNSSLAGAQAVLLDRNLIPEVDEIARKITYREMNEDGELMSILQGAMFIPHTDPEVLKG